MALEHDDGGMVDGGTVQPLTRRNAEGITYVRTDEVARQIAEAVRLTPQ